MNTIHKTEVINLKALKWAIKNYTTLKIDRQASQSLKNLEYQKYDDLDILKNMLKNCRKNGTSQTAYTQGTKSNETGRYYVKGGVGLCAMMRELRSLLARDNYYDVDIVNCDPTLLAQFCTKYHANVDITCLQNYVDNRDILLGELMSLNDIKREQAKDAILQASKGGYGAYSKLAERPTWLSDLKKEFVIIGKTLMTEHPEVVPSSESKSKWGSVLSKLIQDVENDVIQCLDEYLTGQDFHVDTLIFDGVLVRNNTKLTKEILVKASAYIKAEVGYDVKLLIKPFDTTLTLPENLLTEDEEYAEIKKEFEKTACKIMNPLSFLVVSEDKRLIFKTREDMKTTYENHSTWKGTTITGGKTPRSFIENWFKDPNNLSYDNLDFLPPPLNCPSSTFNTYKGLDVEKLEGAKYDQKYVDTIRAHTKYMVSTWTLTPGIWWEDDDVNNNYFEAFFANIVQTPGKLSQVAIVLKSREGCGKNLYLELIEAILGKEYYISTAKAKDKLFGKFNASKMNKLLINLDETCAKDSREYYEIIKAEITNPTTQIERKGHDSVTVRNMARYFFTTNNELPIKISKSDRRFVLFECSAKKKAKKYYDVLKSYLTNSDALYSYYKHLMSIDLKGYDFSKRPITPFYTRSVQQCEENIYEFLQTLVLNDIEVDDNDVKLKDGTYMYRASLFYQLYVQFCIDRKYVNRLSHTSFGSTVTMVASKSRDKKGHLYKFEKHVIQDYLEDNGYWEEPEIESEHDTDDES
jgi:hypothetical protein